MRLCRSQSQVRACNAVGVASTGSRGSGCCDPSRSLRAALCGQSLLGSWALTQPMMSPLLFSPHFHQLVHFCSRAAVGVRLSLVQSTFLNCPLSLTFWQLSIEAQGIVPQRQDQRFL